MLSMIPRSPNELLASWSEPQPPNGEITGYTINCSSPSSVMVEPVLVDGSVMATTLRNLIAFTNYTCTISASTRAGTGDTSNPDTERTAEDGKLSGTTKSGL